MTARDRTVRARRRWMVVALLLCGIPWGSAWALESSVAAPLTTAEVVERMVEMNRRRTEALRSYTAIRAYHVENRSRRADLVVKMTYRWPDQKEFTVLSESGSKFLRDHVLKRLVKAEMESMEKANRQQREMDPSNYHFALVGYERTPARDLYVLEVTPKSKKKFLFRGRIWVDAEDFGIVRMEGEPAKNPSWWTKKIDILHSYEKIGDFWLPARNETVTAVRIFGQSLVTIEYNGYELTEVRSMQGSSQTEVGSGAGVGQYR